MDAVINDFVQVLRRHRLRVSPAESLDALHALKQVGLGEREVVRDTLRATLIKNQEDTETFDRLFDLFFSLPDRLQRGYTSGRDDPAATAAAMRAVFDRAPWRLRRYLLL
jgi:uncharacterized protein